jgi:hypothetical protein
MGDVLRRVPVGVQVFAVDRNGAKEVVLAIPPGATYTAVCFFVCASVGRYFQWYVAENDPLSFVLAHLDCRRRDHHRLATA